MNLLTCTVCVSDSYMWWYRAASCTDGMHVGCPPRPRVDICCLFQSCRTFEDVHRATRLLWHSYSHGNESICSWLVFDTQHIEALLDNCPQMEIDGPLLSLFKGGHTRLWTLFIINQKISCFVLEQPRQAQVRLSLVAQRVFFHPHTCAAGEWHDTSVPDSPSHPSQSALAEFGLAGTLTAQRRSCESTLHTHRKQNTTLGNQTHTHTCTPFHRAEVCAFLITPVTWKH